MPLNAPLHDYRALRPYTYMCRYKVKRNVRWHPSPQMVCCARDGLAARRLTTIAAVAVVCEPMTQRPRRPLEVSATRHRRSGRVEQRELLRGTGSMGRQELHVAAASAQLQRLREGVVCAFSVGGNTG